MTKDDPFKYFRTSREIIRLAVMLYVRFPLSLRNVEDLLHERGIDVSYESIRYWWHRFGPMFAAEIRRRRIDRMRAFSSWRWHVDEMFVKINGETRYLWRVVDHEGEVLEAVVTKRRDRKAALKFLRKLMRRYGRLRGVQALGEARLLAHQALEAGRVGAVGAEVAEDLGLYLREKIYHHRDAIVRVEEVGMEDADIAFAASA